MSYPLKKALIGALLISFSAIQGQTGLVPPVKPEERVALHCEFDQGTATTSIALSETNDLQKIILARFGVSLIHDFKPCEQELKIKREIKINAKSCSYAAYLELHYKKNYRC